MQPGPAPFPPPPPPPPLPRPWQRWALNTGQQAAAQQLWVTVKAGEPVEPRVLRPHSQTPPLRPVFGACSVPSTVFSVGDLTGREQGTWRCWDFHSVTAPVRVGFMFCLTGSHGAQAFATLYSGCFCERADG